MSDLLRCFLAVFWLNASSAIPANRCAIAHYLEQSTALYLRADLRPKNKAIVRPRQDFETKDWNAIIADRASLRPPLRA